MSRAFFADVKFYLIGLADSDVEDKLLAHGAQKHHYLSDILTLCIAKEYDDEVAEAMDLYQLKVVKPDWVDLSIECQAALPTKAFEIKADLEIFKGLKFHISEVNKKDSELLWSVVKANGGRVLRRLSANITHLISNSPHPKLPPALNNLSLHVVHTMWVVESHRGRSRLPENEYHPSLFEEHLVVQEARGGTETKVDVVENNNSRKLEESRTVTNIQKTTVFPATREASWLSKGIFGKYVFYMEDYRQAVGDEEMLLWRQLIRGEGGSVVDVYTAQVSHLLCPNQASQHYKQAKKDKKELRTAYWLNDCLVSKELLPPNPFLHVPYPPSITTTLHPHVISTTNVRGYDKVLLQRVVAVLGGQTTADFSKKNTMLIYKSDGGMKMQKAKEWNIPTISVDRFYEHISLIHPFKDAD